MAVWEKEDEEDGEVWRRLISISKGDGVFLHVGEQENDDTG